MGIGRGIEVGEVLEGLPEGGPALARRAANVDFGAFDGFFVGDVEGIPGVGGEMAGVEIGTYKILGEADDDYRFWRGSAIAALPGGVDSADGARKAEAFAV